MSSASEARAAACLRRLLTEIGDPRAAAEADARLDTALANAVLPEAPPGRVTKADLDRALVAVVEAIYAHGLPCPQKLVGSDALAEAMALLEEGYAGEHDRGYELALFEATAEDGVAIEFVLRSLAETVRRRLRVARVRWLFARLFLAQEWPVRVEMVDLLKTEIAPYVRPDLLARDSRELVGHALDLLIMHCETTRTAQDIANPRPTLRPR